MRLNTKIKKVTIPETFSKGINNYYDGVKFQLFDRKRKRYTTEDDTKACYYQIMTTLGKQRIRCLPNAKQKLDYTTFIKWIKLCKRAKIVTATAKTSNHKVYGNVLEIIWPERYDKHLIYATLCCYRWADSSPGMVWWIVNFAEANKNVTFWQIFHYALMVYGRNGGHSFFAPGGYYQKNYNLSESIALKQFFLKTIKSRKRIAGATSVAIYKLKQKTPSCKVDFDKVTDSQTLLDPCWKPLYYSTSKEEITANFKAIATKLKNICNIYFDPTFCGRQRKTHKI